MGAALKLLPIIWEIHPQRNVNYTFPARPICEKPPNSLKYRAKFRLKKSKWQDQSINNGQSAIIPITVCNNAVFEFAVAWSHCRIKFHLRLIILCLIFRFCHVIRGHFHPCDVSLSYIFFFFWNLFEWLIYSKFQPALQYFYSLHGNIPSVYKGPYIDGLTSAKHTGLRLFFM